MGHLKIHCDGCGYDWTVYHRDDWKDWKARTCPMCGESISQDTWDSHVLRAFGEMEDANLELMKDHSQYHGTLFTVGYTADVIYPNKSNNMELKEELEELREGIDGMRKAMLKMVDAIMEE